MKQLAAGTLAIFLTTLSGLSEEKSAPSAEPTLCVGNYQSEADAVRQLERFAAGYSTREEWLNRADRIRRQILSGAGLNPLPERTPLNPVIHRRRNYKGYSVESAAFEARPGFFVYGNLYRPLDGIRAF